MRLLLSILFFIFLLVNLTFGAVRKGEPPQINRHIESIIRIPEGTKFALILCPIRSNPKNDGVIVSWLKDGEEIGTEWPQYKFTNNNRELKIKEPQRHDAGVYTCRAVNGFGHAEVDFTVDIYDPGNDIPLLPNESIVYATKPSPPLWYNEGEEVARQTRNGAIYLSPGERLELRCPATGNPLPIITWYKNDHPLDMGELRRHNDAKLQLDDVTRNDSGRYSCMLENRHGTIRETFVVLVGGPGVSIKKLKNSFEQASELDSEAWGGSMKNTPIIDEPQNATIRQGHTAKFTCHLAGSKLNFRWLKQTNNPAEATITIRNKTFTILEQNENSTITTTNAKGNKIQSNTLVIESATETNNGKYFCVITGADGYVGYRSAQLNVIPRPSESSPIDSFFQTLIIIIAGVVVTIASLVTMWLICYSRGSGKGSTQSKSTCSGSDCYPISSNGTSSAATKKTLLPAIIQPQQIPPPPPRLPLPEAPTFSPIKPPNTYVLPPHMNNTPTGSPLLYNGERRLRQPPSTTLDRRYRPQPLLHRTYAEDEMSRLSSNIYDSGSPLPPPPSHAGVPSSNSSHVYCTTSPKLSRYQRLPMDQMDGYGYDDSYLGYNYREQQPFVNSSQRWISGAPEFSTGPSHLQYSGVSTSSSADRLVRIAELLSDETSSPLALQETSVCCFDSSHGPQTTSEASSQLIPEPK